MNVNIKQKLAGKSAYIALGLLLVLILVFTVIAIVAAVNAQEEPVTPPTTDNAQGNGGEGSTPPVDDTQTGGDVTEPDVPSGGDQSPEDTPSGGEAEPDDTPSGGEIKEQICAPCDGYIQKDYSEDVLVFSQTMNDHRIHLGVDIAGKVGDPVKALAKGTVEKIYSDSFMGKTVIIDHGNGLRSVYMNLAADIPEGITEGKTVDAGTVIGAIGETAIAECADHPHLHFEIRVDSKKVDPKDHVTLPSASVSDDAYEG